MQLTPTLIGLAVTALILAGLLIVLVTRRKASTIDARFKRASIAMLAHSLIPDGEGGEIHIEYAMLSPLGILIVDIKDVSGNVFGSDTMQDWTVITGKKRFTFSNPQPGLYDRVAAVSRLVPNVPVTGYVAFTEQAKFSKGTPGRVITLENLLVNLAGDQAPANKVNDAYWPAWEQLNNSAVAAPSARLAES